MCYYFIFILCSFVRYPTIFNRCTYTHAYTCTHIVRHNAQKKKKNKKNKKQKRGVELRVLNDFSVLFYVITRTSGTKCTVRPNFYQIAASYRYEKRVLLRETQRRGTAGHSVRFLLEIIRAFGAAPFTHVTFPPRDLQSTLVTVVVVVRLRREVGRSLQMRAAVRPISDTGCRRLSATKIGISPIKTKRVRINRLDMSDSDLWSVISNFQSEKGLTYRFYIDTERILFFSFFRINFLFFLIMSQTVEFILLKNMIHLCKFMIHFSF